MISPEPESKRYKKIPGGVTLGILYDDFFAYREKESENREVLIDDGAIVAFYLSVILQDESIDTELIEGHEVTDIEKISVLVEIFYLSAHFHEESEFSLDTVIELEDVIDALLTGDDRRPMKSYHLGADIAVSRMEPHDLDKRRQLIDLIAIKLDDRALDGFEGSLSRNDDEYDDDEVSQRDSTDDRECNESLFHKMCMRSLYVFP